MTLRFSDADRTPVYSKASADEIGRVTRYLLDARAHRIAAVQIGGRRQKALFADWDHVVGFGPDAVVIDDEDHLRHPATDYESRVAAGNLDLRGRRVLTDAGYEIGPLIDGEFDEQTGEVTALETDRARVAGAGLLAVGPYAVIVRHATVEPATQPHTL